jgi:hypothetical protein
MDQETQVPVKSFADAFLADKIFRIADDALFHAAGEHIEDAMQACWMEKMASENVRMKKTAFNWSSVMGAADRYGKGLGTAGAISLGLLGSYIGGQRLINYLQRKLGGDPLNRGNLPDAYEGIRRYGPRSDYKFEGEDAPTQSRSVDQPDFYLEESNAEPWNQQSRFYNYWNANQQYGIPADFGIAPGFGVGGSPENIEESPFYQQYRERLPRYRRPIDPVEDSLPPEFKALSMMDDAPATAKNENENVRVAQAGGSFRSDTLDTPNIEHNLKNFIFPNSSEQLLSQGAGQWAFPSNPESSFYDPTHTMGRDRPMEWKPPGYGQDVAYMNPVEGRLRRMQAFNAAEPQRLSFKQLWMQRQIEAAVKEGILTPEDAYKYLAILNMNVNQNPNISPELAGQVEGLTGRGQNMPMLPSYLRQAIDVNPAEVNWYQQQDPWANTRRNRLIEQGLSTMNRFRNDPMYQSVSQQYLPEDTMGR